MIQRILVGVLLVCGLAQAKEKYPYRMLVNDLMTQELKIIEKDGTISWTYPLPGNSFDAQVLDNGNILFCYFNKKAEDAGVREINRAGETVWEFKVAQECHAVQRLVNGNTMLTDPASRQLIEVNRAGNVLVRLPLKTDTPKTHRVTRGCRKLENGNYLVVHEGDKLVREYAPDGSTVMEFPAHNAAYYAERLPNGNTLVGGGNTHSAFVVNSAGETVWEYKLPPEMNPEWIVGAYRLKNGNTLVLNWLGHGADGKGTSIVEVTPAQEVVWTYEEPVTLNYMRILE